MGQSGNIDCQVNSSITISNDVEQFHADYNKLPVPVNGSAVSGDTDTDTSPESRLVTIFTGKEGSVSDPQNPKNNDYLFRGMGFRNQPSRFGLTGGNMERAGWLV